MKYQQPPASFPIHLEDINRLPQAFTGADIVLLSFIRYCTEQYGYCCFDHYSLPLKLNMSEPTLRRCRNKLIKQGCITRYYPVGTTSPTSSNVAYIYIPPTLEHPDEFLVGDLVRVSAPEILSGSIHTVEAVDGNKVKLKGFMPHISTDNNNVIKIR